MGHYFGKDGMFGQLEREFLLKNLNFPSWEAIMLRKLWLSEGKQKFSIKNIGNVPPK